MNIWVLLFWILVAGFIGITFVMISENKAYRERRQADYHAMTIEQLEVEEEHWSSLESIRSSDPIKISYRLERIRKYIDMHRSERNRAMQADLKRRIDSMVAKSITESRVLS